jgi:hypothetical protein
VGGEAVPGGGRGWHDGLAAPKEDEERQMVGVARLSLHV